MQTERLGLGPLIENPVMRHPSVIASSIATVAALTPQRTILGYPTPPPGGPHPGYIERFATEVIPLLKSATEDILAADR